MSSNRLAALRPLLLMGPGPSCVPPSVSQALAQPTIGHLDPAFIGIMDETKALLRTLLETTNALTLPISGTGSAGMEALFVNLVEPDDRVLVLINGVFGQRMTEVATRLGARVDSLSFEWGTAVDPAAVATKLNQEQFDLVAVVHAETSTGVCNPVEEIGRLVREHGALYAVDAVTSLGGIPLRTDAWHIDALYSGTQKCLSCPPGLAPLTFSDRAVSKLRSRQRKVPNWYLDLSLIIDYWDGAKRSYHHTAPINMIYGLYQALLEIVNEGVDAVHQRHARAHERLVQGLEELGLQMLVAPSARLPMLNAVRIPPGTDDVAIRQTLLRDHGIEIGGGLGPLAGTIWRIGLMGHTARPDNVDRLLAVLRACQLNGASLAS